jgi:hypothetical protein
VGPWQDGKGGIGSPKAREKPVFSAVSHVAEIRLEKAGLEHLQSFVLCSERAAGPCWGASPERLALTLCCQRRCHSRMVHTIGLTWAGSRDQGEEWAHLPLHAQVRPSLSRSKHVSLG